ncbi:hypothetical protein ACWNYY_00285 [Candidatus Karelsulcia muelleri]
MWEIQSISNSGFLFLNNNLKKKTLDRYCLYNLILTYKNQGNLIAGLLIPNKNRNIKMKIDIGTQDIKEVYSLGINLGDKVALQEEFSIFKKKYLLSNEIIYSLGN